VRLFFSFASRARSYKSRTFELAIQDEQKMKSSGRDCTPCRLFSGFIPAALQQVRGQCCLSGIFEIILFMYASARSAVDGSGIVQSSVTRTLVEMAPIWKWSRSN